MWRRQLHCICLHEGPGRRKRRRRRKGSAGQETWDKHSGNAFPKVAATSWEVEKEVLSLVFLKVGYLEGYNISSKLRLDILLAYCDGIANMRNKDDYSWGGFQPCIMRKKGRKEKIVYCN